MRRQGEELVAKLRVALVQRVLRSTAAAALGDLDGCPGVARRHLVADELELFRIGEEHQVARLVELAGDRRRMIGH
jgi:hypothetical protein